MKNNYLPRKCRLENNAPIELAIRTAMQQVEKLRADEQLTNISTMLGEALEEAHNYIDNEMVQCECGRFAYSDISKMDDDGNWYCPDCLAEMEFEKMTNTNKI